VGSAAIPNPGSRAGVRGIDWRAASSVLGTAVSRRPPIVTVSLIAAIASTSIRLQVGGQLPERRLLAGGFSARSLANGGFFRLLTSTLLTRDIFMTVSIAVSLLVTLGAYEVIAGHLRVIVVALVTAVAGPVGVATGLGVLSSAGIRWASTPMATVDIGASAMVAGASGAVAVAIGSRRVTAGLALFILGGLLVHHQLADWEHLVAFPIGMLLARLLGQRSAPVRTRRRTCAYAAIALLTAGAAVLAMTWILPNERTSRDVAGRTISPARLLDTSYPSPALGGTRRVVILLPAGYDSSTRRYPVVELLHGNPGRPEDLLTVGNLERSAVAPGIQPFIAVIPDGRGPHIADGWYANTPAQNLGTAVGTDLRHWANHTLRVTDSWSYAGLSAGGFGAAYLAMNDLQPVHAVCGLSGDYTANIPPLTGTSATLHDRSNPTRHANQAPALTFLAYGTTDATSGRDANTYAAALRAANRTAIVHAYTGAPQWAVWTPAFADCFRTILPSSTGPLVGPGAPDTPR
jgi:enterochelin esterase-like enzyme